MQWLITINSKVKMDQELSGYLKSVLTLQTHEITIMNHKKQSCFILSHDIIAWQIFATRKSKQNILHKHSQNKYLFI